MKRLLCILNTMGTGGAEAFLMKLYRGIDKSKYEFDFAIFSDKKAYYEEEIYELGGRIFYLPKKSAHPIKSIRSLYSTIKNNNYNYVLRMGQHSGTMIDLIIAKIAGAKVCAYRSINSSLPVGTSMLIKALHYLFFPLCLIVPDVKLAPSIEAAKFMFGRRAVDSGKVIILKNGLNLDEYKFDERARNEVRDSLNIDKELLVGHIGRFSEEKNHKFIINVFGELLKTKEAYLLLVGSGKLEKEIKTLVKSKGISDRVFFMKNRNDIPAILSAMDIMLFPSLFEGMPNVIIEAQANGLPCVISNTISDSAMLVGNVSNLSLNAPIEKWIATILNNCDRVPSSVSTQILKDDGYDIADVIAVFIKAIFGYKKVRK